KSAAGLSRGRLDRFFQGRPGQLQGVYHAHTDRRSTWSHRPIRAALGYVDACLQRGETWIAYAAIRRAIKLPYGATFRSAVLASSHWKDALAARGLTRTLRLRSASA